MLTEQGYEVNFLEVYDPGQAGDLRMLMTKAIDEFLKTYPGTSKREVIMAIEVTWDAYQKEVYRQWSARS